MPCKPSSFTDRWRERGTVDAIRKSLTNTGKLGPIELKSDPQDRESALLQALITIGVVERRAENHINMPDLFRVEAKIKRRGGVKPPARPR
ncbi:hypothetical protein [Skermanella pratensis]|uniref:hypothetical protein n=1 Tax=Skermanella pratensis TaxID=2233999 RepID=UPI00130185B6|nr:hypothetical protein [Skermanella pratensis]